MFLVEHFKALTKFKAERDRIKQEKEEELEKKATMLDDYLAWREKSSI